MALFVLSMYGARHDDRGVEDPDAELVRRILAEDSAAFAELVERYGPSLWRMVLSTVADVQQAEDSLQEIYLKVFRSLATFRFESPFRHWLFRLAAREAVRGRSRLRRALGWFAGAEPIEPGDPRPKPGHELEQAEEVMKVLRPLARNQRAAFGLYAEGFTHSEIATLMSRPVGTISIWIKRARGELQKQLSVDAPAPELDPLKMETRS